MASRVDAAAFDIDSSVKVHLYVVPLKAVFLNIKQACGVCYRPNQIKHGVDAKF